jgi:alpha-galactosidase
MKALADYVHSKGLKLGVYTDTGTYTCSSGERPYRIPGSYGHYEQDAATFASWGVDWVKMDWCNTNINGTQLDPRIQYPEMSRALNKTGRPIWFSACEWGKKDPWFWAAPYTNSWRATGDHHDQWHGSTSSIIHKMADKSRYAGPGGWNDYDFVFTGGQGCNPPSKEAHCPGQTDQEYRTEFSMWALANSPLIVATDIRVLTPIMKEVLFNKDVIAINQDPLGKAGDRLGWIPCSNTPGHCQIWTKPLIQNKLAVGLLNMGNHTHTMTLPFSMLPRPYNQGPLYLYDCWSHTSPGVVHNQYSAVVPAHGIVLLTVQQARPE